jgi:hypothetical protein
MPLRMFREYLALVRLKPAATRLHIESDDTMGATMLVYDENITIKDRDGNVIGRCCMLGWVTVSEGGLKSWKGEFLAIAGTPLDFDFPSIEKSGLQIECEDGASAKILTPMIEDARSFGYRCTFEGIWPPPRPVVL